MNNLLEVFSAAIFNFQFLWIVVAITITMEVAKWTVLKADTNSKVYPYIVLAICVVWVGLKTAVVGDWRELAANVFFTVMMADFIYTYLGQYIINGLKWGLKRITGNVGE